MLAGILEDRNTFGDVQIVRMYASLGGEVCEAPDSEMDVFVARVWLEHNLLGFVVVSEESGGMLW